METDNKLAKEKMLFLMYHSYPTHFCIGFFYDDMNLDLSINCGRKRLKGGPELL